jgi:chalcone isomerase-like protein
MRTRCWTAFAGCLTACLAAPAWAAELAGVTLPEQTTVEGSTLVLNGMGLREATWLKVNVYVAGLYLEAKSSDADAILSAEIPKRFVFVFVRSVGRKRLIREWDESLKANIGEDFGVLEDRVATLHAWMPDAVRKGDEMTLTYLPGKGVVVEIKGEPRGTIPGADFARALFTIWLGARPPNHALKTGLLRGEDPGRDHGAAGQVIQFSGPRRPAW